LAGLIESNQFFTNPPIHVVGGDVATSGEIINTEKSSSPHKDPELEAHQLAQIEMFKNLGIKTDMKTINQYIDILVEAINGNS
jgi:hypothetical protein